MERPIIPNEVIIKLKKLIKKIETAQMEIGDIPITPAQIRILFPILKTGIGHTMQELSSYASVDKSHVSRIINELEQKEIVKRDCKKSDKAVRNYKIVLTDKAKQLNLNYENKVSKIISTSFNNVSQKDLQKFIKILDIIIENK